MNIEQLDSVGFVTVQYPPSLRTHVADAMAAWQKFCALPMETKLTLSKGERNTDFGYMVRMDAGPRSDHKEQFHLSRNMLPELYERAREIPDRRALEFIHRIEVLLSEVQVLVEAFAKEVEARYSMAGFAEEVLKARDNWVFRYIHYFGADMLAHAHADRGGFTLHLHESDEGGEYYDFNNQWKPWPLSTSQTIIFPGMGLQYRSSGKLKALWHRVVPTKITKHAGRYSMVAFFDFERSFKYNDKGKRLQDYDPGFNYQMAFEDFSALYTAK